MSVRKDLQDLILNITPTTSPFFSEIKFYDKYESAKLFIRKKPWYLPKIIHRKLIEYLIGIEILTKPMTWVTYAEMKKKK